MCAVSLSMWANDTTHYSLSACREMALTHSASAKIEEESLLAAKYSRQAALAAMFPRVSVNGGYMWNSRNMHLLGDQTVFQGLGTATASSQGGSFAWSDQSALSQLIQQFQGTILEQPLVNFQQGAGQIVADAYQKLYDILTIKTHHVLVAQAGITQPIYLGGRLIQTYKIAKSAEKLAQARAEGKHDDIIYNVDEAYWRMVSVAQKRELAEQYYQLLVLLEGDVTEAVNEGMATQSDLLKVMTKRGEAEVKRLQAENGLTLSRMALAQVCGLPLSEVFTVDATGLDDISLPADSADAAASVDQRSEMQIMEEMEKMAKSAARLASAGLQPNIVASANYIYTNPNAENGVRSDWHGNGFFSVGVAVHIPIAHADAILRYKAAKHAANMATLKVEETRELLTLQTTQANQKLMEAEQKIALARLTVNNAEEVLRMAEESFHAGMITSHELMQAQTAWMAAATDLIDAQAEAKTTETKLRKYMRKL